jgi:hypothetical protein
MVFQQFLRRRGNATEVSVPLNELYVRDFLTFYVHFSQDNTYKNGFKITKNIDVGQANNYTYLDSRDSNFSW